MYRESVKIVYFNVKKVLLVDIFTAHRKVYNKTRAFTIQEAEDFKVLSNYSRIL